MEQIIEGIEEGARGDSRIENGILNNQCILKVRIGELEANNYHEGLNKVKDGIVNELEKED